MQDDSTGSANLDQEVIIPDNPLCTHSKSDVEAIYYRAQEELKKVLDIKKHVGKTLKDTNTDHPYHTDRTDDQAVEDLAVLLSRSGNNAAKTVLLQHTILQILQGKYTGCCLTCGETINIQRLQVIPETQSCVKCLNKAKKDFKS